MLKESDHIDKLFSDFLGDYEEKAPGYLWNNIQSELNNQKKVRRNSRLQAIAATIALLLTFGLGYLSSDITKKSQNEARHLDLNYLEKNENVVNQTRYESKKTYNENSIKIKKAESEYIAENKTVIDNRLVESKGFLYKMFDSSKDKFLPISFQDEKPKSVTLKNKKESEKTSNQLLIDTLLLEEGNLPEGGFLLSKREDKFSRWSFGTKFSPVYSLAEPNDNMPVTTNRTLKSAVSNGNPNTQVSEKAALAFSGGLNVNYHFAHRWSIESGLFYSQSRRIADNLVGSSVNGANNQMAIYTPEGVKQISSDLNSFSSQAIGSSRGEVYYSSNMDFVTNYDYLELPFLIRYKIIDNKFGFDVLSGISTNFLIGNRSSIVQDDISVWTGQAQEISPLLYNATLGFGLNYNFYRSLSFNLEPTFKYSLINPETANAMKYPYSFAIFAGFSYRFK